MSEYRRLTDSDTNIGPITIGGLDNSWRPIGVTLESGCDEYPGCSLKIYAAGRTIRIALPSIIKPWKNWVDTSKYEWSNPGSGYWEIFPNEYGFRLHEGFLQVFFGPQTHDSITTKSWCTHLPWTQWRHVRWSFYDLEGNHFWTEPKKCDFDIREKYRNECPSAKFEVEDFDGERIIATTRIEELEWRFGEKWCSWLSIFRKPMIRRSLTIEFDKEVGKSKGSWKGGLMGTGIDMVNGETHEAAFRRFCLEEIRSKNGASRISFVAKI